MQFGPLEFDTRQRIKPSRLEIGVISTLTVILAFLLFSLVFWAAGVDPLNAYWKLITYSFFSTGGLEFTIRRTTFMILITLAFIVPIRAGIWNIGVPAQVFAGMTASLAIGLHFAEMSSVFLLPLMFLGALLAGALIAAFAGYLIGKFKVDSVVLTIMFNFIMMYFTLYLIEGPLGDPSGRNESAQVPLPGRIPTIADTSIPYTIFLALFIAVLLYVLFQYTTLGYEIESYGKNPDAAHIVGISFTKVSLITMSFAGLIGGLGGLHQVAGEPGVYRITSGFWTDVGMWSFYGIIFGLLAYNNPLASIFPTFVFSGFQVGARRFEYLLGMNFGIDLAFFGTLMIVLVFGQFFFRKKLTVRYLGGSETTDDI